MKKIGRTVFRFLGRADLVGPPLLLLVLLGLLGHICGSGWTAYAAAGELVAKSEKAEMRSESAGLRPQILAIQRRPYLLKKEIALNLSYLPLDNFTRYFSLGLSPTYYFNDYLGWEVVNANLAKANSTGLNEFIRSHGAETDPFDILQWYVTTNIIYTPIYMKNLFMNDSVVWGDLSFVGGYGISSFRDAKNVHVIDGGFFMRIFVAERWALRLDLRQFVYFSAGINPNLSATVGVSYNLKSETDANNAHETSSTSTQRGPSQ